MQFCNCMQSKGCICNQPCTSTGQLNWKMRPSRHTRKNNEANNLTIQLQQNKFGCIPRNESNFRSYSIFFLKFLIFLCNVFATLSAPTTSNITNAYNNLNSTESRNNLINLNPTARSIRDFGSTTNYLLSTMEKSGLAKTKKNDTLLNNLTIPGLNSSLTTYFNEDCADPNFPEVHCRVHYADCSLSVSAAFEVNSAALEYVKRNGQNAGVGAPHDVRFEPFAKALARNRNSKHHRLTVDLSWQIPPNNITKHLTGFTLEITELNNRQALQCFFFNISESIWTPETILSSPRLHFLSTGVFQFSRIYNVTVHVLPSAEIHRQFTTPNDPNDEGIQNSFNDMQSRLPIPSQNCTKFSNEFASQWTAGFRRIILHTLARMIQVEFIGAPPQYCFEQYEVRLLDETATEMLHSGIVYARDMRLETIDNMTMYFGEYNFTNLELDRSYIPSLIPVERAVDGRCLCPVNSADPYDNKVICSCVAADWKPIRLNRFDIVQNDLNSLNNSALLPYPPIIEDNNVKFWKIIITINIIIFVVIGVMIYILFVYYRRLKSGRMRFVKTVNVDEKKSTNQNGGAGLYLESIDAAGKALLILSSMDDNAKDDLHQISILIVYAHDCAEHESAVEALAQFLRDIFRFRVALDVWDEAKIEHNMLDYLSASIINADKVIIINSIGASQRFHTKVTNATSKYIVERNSPGQFDNLFLSQLDMALQHHCIISARFTGTTYANILPILNSRLQYLLPDNLAQFVGALLGTSKIRQDSRMKHPLALRIAECVRALNTKTCTDPEWFIKTHHLRAVHDDSYAKLMVPTETEQVSLPLIEPLDNEVISNMEMDLLTGEDKEVITNDSAIGESILPTNTTAGRAHVQSKPEQPTSTISFDSDLVSAGASDRAVVNVPQKVMHRAITTPLVTVIPASLMPAIIPTPLLSSEPQLAEISKESSNTLTSSPSSSLSLSNEDANEIKNINCEDKSQAITDSGIFTFADDSRQINDPTKFHYIKKKLPSTTVMITHKEDLKNDVDNSKQKVPPSAKTNINDETYLNTEQHEEFAAGNGTINGVKNYHYQKNFDINQNLYVEIEQLRGNGREIVKPVVETIKPLKSNPMTAAHNLTQDDSGLIPDDIALAMQTLVGSP